MRIVNVASEYRKRFALIVTGAVLGLGLALAPAAGAITIGGPSDCDNNAVISCGAHSTSALMQAYHSSTYVQKVYAYFGISAADMASLNNTNVAGSVTKDGKVFVDGQSRAVATSGVTGGRQNMPGSTQVNFQGITFFKRPPSVSFQQSSLPAFVSMKNGQFQFAIIASCGNAVRAVPTARPTPTAVAPAKPVSKPKPQAKPAPSQVQSQQQQQQVNVNQSQNVTVPSSTTTTTPSAPSAQTSSNLPNTGPAGTIGVFLASTLLGTWGYRRFMLHRLTG